MQDGAAKQATLTHHEYMKEQKNPNQIQPPSIQHVNDASGSFVFQLDSPKQKNIQLLANQKKEETSQLFYNQHIEGKRPTQLIPFSYQLELASQGQELASQGQEPQKALTIKTQKQIQPNKQATSNHEQNSETKNNNSIKHFTKDQRKDRMSRRTSKDNFKDILNSPQVVLPKTKPIETIQKQKQLKNIEYAELNQHSQMTEHENQRTENPLKQAPLAVKERIEGLRDQSPKQVKQTKQLPPLKRQRIQKQQQQTNFIYQNDGSIMALDRFTETKHKSQAISPANYQQEIFKRFAFEAIPCGPSIKFLFKRQKNCMQNYYHPQYSLLFEGKKHVFSARKECCHINSHYNISCEEKNYQKTGCYYAGCLKGNFTGTHFNLFSSNHLASQIVATITYKAELNCFQQNYRQLEVYMKNQDYAYSQLAGYHQGQVIDLKQLYGVSDNAREKKIVKLINKKAEWCQSLNAFVMNFKGKLKMASVKNMILVQQGNQHQNVLMLCKEQQSSFYLQVANPLDPHIAMGIVLSSFDFKLFCQ